MIEGLVTVLGVKLDLTGEEIADVLWLVAHMQEPDQVVEEESQSTQDTQPTSDGHDAVADRPEPLVEENESPKEATDSSTEAEGELYPKDDRQGLNDLSFQVPDARSLREPLELARALKPLLRRVPSKTLEPVLDEEATVQRIADERIWAPVLQPALEPWLDLILVVDESPSMLIWQRTVLEFQRILERYGVFRNVSTWSLTPEGEHDLKLCPGLGKIARNQRPHSASELLDPNGRRLVVVASDCVSLIWQQKTVLPLLKLWAENGPLVIAQMLPQWLWNRTALGVAAGAEFAGLEPGVPNKRLTTRPLSRRSKVNLWESIKIPVVTLQSEEFSTWAGMLAGKGNTWAKGFVYSPEKHDGAAISPIREVPASLTAEERVQRFRLTASPMARKLASLLASAPVINLPVVRIIQDSLLKESRQVHVAEVFLGGLLEQVTEIRTDTKSYNVQFDFLKGVRELLLESVPKAEIIDVINEVSAFVAENVGLSLEEFAAVLRSPEEIEDKTSANQASPFARVAAQILKRLGGDYRIFAEQLEFSIRQLSINSEESISKIDEILDGSINSVSESTVVDANPAEEQNIINIGTGETITIQNFGGVGRGSRPNIDMDISEIDTLQFEGSGFTPDNLILNQEGEDLTITFEGVDNTKVTLKDFSLDDLDGLSDSEKSSSGDILFDSENIIRDDFDVLGTQQSSKQIFGTERFTLLDYLKYDASDLNTNEDSIHSPSDDVFMLGSRYEDVLVGDRGDDTNIGSKGEDILHGGIGEDRFIVTSDFGADTITDFEDQTVLQDDLKLSDLENAISNLSFLQLDQLIFAINISPNLLPSRWHSKKEKRIQSILRWAESPVGCGLEVLTQLALRQSATGTPTQIQERWAVFEALLNLKPRQFEQLVFAIHPPAGAILSSRHPREQRISLLLEWAASLIGCGLETLEQFLRSQPTETAASIQVQQRWALFESLFDLQPRQFDELAMLLGTPVGNIPPLSAPKENRISALLEWVESPIGCGLESLELALRRSITTSGSELTPVHIASNKSASSSLPNSVESTSTVPFATALNTNPPQARMLLFNWLSSLPEPQFEEVVFALQPPQSIVPSASVPQGHRVVELLKWVERPEGIGLESCAQILEEIVF